MPAKKKPKSTHFSTGRTAHVIPFPRRSDKCNRLTDTDRIDAEHWANGAARAWCRIAVFADPAEADEIGDFISVYRLGQDWASWGVARRNDSVCLWRANYGTDLGTFPTVGAALAAIIPHTVSRSGRASVDDALEIALSIIGQRITVAERLVADHRAAGRKQSAVFSEEIVSELQGYQETIRKAIGSGR